MKKYLAILVTLSILLSLPFSVYGEDKVTLNAMNLTLEQAYKLMETNNLEMKLLDKKIELAEAQYEDISEAAQDAKKRNIEAAMKGNTVTLEMKKAEVLDYKLKWLDITSAKNNRDDRFESLKIEIKDQFFNLQLLKEDISYLKEDISIIDKRLQDIQLRIELGQVKDSEYKSLYSQKLTIQNQLNLVNTQYESAMINLKKTVGIELAQPIELEKLPMPYQVVNRDTLKADMIKSIETSFSIYKLNKEIEYKNQEIQLVKQYTDYRVSSEYKDLVRELSELELELAYEKLNLEAHLWVEYYNLQIFEDNIKLEEVNLDIAKINYDSTLAKAKLGMVDSITELNAKTTYNRQKTSLQRAMFDYIIAVEKFNENLK